MPKLVNFVSELSPYRAGLLDIALRIGDGDKMIA